MKLEVSYDLPVSVEAWYAMATDHEFQIEKCKRAGALEQSSEVTSGEDAAVVSTTRVMDTGIDGMPEAVKKIVGAQVTIIETVRWAPPADDGSRRGDVHIKAASQPIEGKGQVTLTPNGKKGASGVIRVDVRARIPLLGGKIERIIAPEFQAALEAEEAVGREWAATGKA